MRLVNNPMTGQAEKMRYLSARLTNKFFLLYKISQSYVLPGRKMKILFSNREDWQYVIQKGFQSTRHEIVFADLAEASLQDYDLVVPLTIRDLNYLHDVGHATGNPLPIPSLECIALCDDKYLFNQTLVEHGFGDVVPQMDGVLVYPYIIKKRIDEWGEHCHIIADDQSALEFADLLSQPDYYSQEFISGYEEYATHILFKDNKVVSSINIKYIFATKKPIKGKSEVIYTQVCRCPYLELFASILKSIGFTGLCCVNYKMKDHSPFLLEINPRFGGSLCPYFFSFIRYLD